MGEGNALLEQALVKEVTALSEATPALVELVLFAPGCATQVQPGQFVHLALPGESAPILRRPLSVYKANRETGSITLLFQVVGEGTRLLSQTRQGTELSILGPLGRGWNPGGAARSLLIGGGVGAAPLFLLACELLAHGAQVDVVLGASSEPFLVCEGSFAQLCGAEHVSVTTDDGSRGLKGFVTQQAAELLALHTYDYVAACGPEPMLKAVVELAAHAGVFSEVSLERRMACGIGACLSCVVDTTSGKKRACADGPVFAGQEVCW